MAGTRSDNQRSRLAERAARWMSEHGSDDPALALRRVVAAEGRAAPDRRQWPSLDEIREALLTRQRLFRGNAQSRALARRRDAALEAMGFFAPFHPMLTGAVLDGTADAHSPVQLHLHAESTEAVLGFLREHAIPYRLGERRIRLDARRQVDVPRIEFDADGVAFELWLLPEACARSAPLEPDGHAPMRRANLAALRRTLESEHALP